MAILLDYLHYVHFTQHFWYSNREPFPARKKLPTFFNLINNHRSSIFPYQVKHISPEKRRKIYYPKQAPLATLLGQLTDDDEATGRSAYRGTRF